METPGSKPIDELIRLAIIGDGTAFTKLWDLNIEGLKSYVKGWMKNLDDFYVDDICSRSFQKAFRQINTYDPMKSQFFTWLRTIAKNTALDVIEKEKRAHNQYVSLDDSGQERVGIENLRDERDTPLETIIRNEDTNQTQAYIEGLPELYREIARKRLVEGYAYKEIADAMGLELNTVRTRIRRAKAMLDDMAREEV